MGSNWLNSIQHFMGIERETVSGAEKLVATLGGIIGISLIAAISYRLTGAMGAALIVPSMGASAVLVFAVPHGKLSQPWALIGGNLISATVGVTCYKLVPDTFLAAGLAVGLAIGAMHVLGCIHPPGGASALAAVIGGPLINELGYLYVLTPVLLNVSIIFLVALIFNNFFPWRRYPATMMRFTEKKPRDKTRHEQLIDGQALEQAMVDMDMVVDVTSEDLQRLFSLALMHARQRLLKAADIKLGHFYTNGRHGPEWAVRRIIDEHRSPDPKKDMVIYRVVEGHGFNTADSCTREEFARWAAREVVVSE